MGRGAPERGALEMTVASVLPFIQTRSAVMYQFLSFTDCRQTIKTKYPPPPKSTKKNHKKTRVKNKDQEAPHGEAIAHRAEL